MDCSAQSISSPETRSASALLIPDQKKVGLLKQPNGMVLNYIVNDTISENYYSLEITEMRGEWSYVHAYSMLDTNKVGWIKTKYLGIYTRNYSEDLLLYVQPTKNSKVKCVFKEWLSDLWEIKDCSNRWLYIIKKIHGKTIEGWLPPEMQCDNPYTTCN